MSKKWVAAFELLVGLIGAYALAQEVFVRRSEGTYDWFDLWSHFTYQSNLFAVVVLILTSTFTFWRGGTGRVLNYLRGAATLYMIITGVVYSLLVNNADPAVMIDHYIMHYFMPVAMVVAWMLHPSEHRIQSGMEQLWLVYPLAYVVFVQVEGAWTDSYVYEFLNPSVHGRMVLFTVIALTIAASVISWILAIPTRRSRRSAV